MPFISYFDINDFDINLSLFLHLSLHQVYSALSIIVCQCFSTIPCNFMWGATIAQWICLHLLSCRPGSSPKHTVNAFVNFYLYHVKRWK